jgi:hypothetical protein
MFFPPPIILPLLKLSVFIEDFSEAVGGLNLSIDLYKKSLFSEMSISLSFLGSKLTFFVITSFYPSSSTHPDFFLEIFSKKLFFSIASCSTSLS